LLVLLFHKRGETQQTGRLTCEMLLHGFQVTPQDIGSGAFADGARLEIEQQL
jgi:hypothetical protein